MTESAPAKVAFVGEIMLDVFVRTADRHGSIVVRAGGTPVNAARAIGDGAIVIGRVGNDAAAAAVRADLGEIQTRFAVDSHLPTGTYVELADGTRHADHGANAALSVDDVLSLNVTAVLVSGYVAAAGEILEQVDAGWRGFIATSRTESIPEAANVVFANDDEAARLDLSNADLAVVTHGAKGATVTSQGTSRHVEATGLSGTGAGDSFAGAFIASLISPSGQKTG